MKCLVSLVTALSLVALVIAFQSRHARQTAADEPNANAEIRAIEAWVARYCEAVTAGDLEAYRAFWTEDVVWLPPNAPVLNGIEACMQYNRPLFVDYHSVETMSAEEVKVAGDFAFVRVNYRYQGTPKTDAPPRLEDGKGIFLLRRNVDGRWISTHCVWNSNTAPAEPTPPLSRSLVR